MLKVSIDEEIGETKIEFSGNLTKAVSAATYIIKDIYDHFKENDALGGELFRFGIQALIIDDNSPVWDGKRSDEDGIKSVEVKLPDCLADFLKGED